MTEKEAIIQLALLLGRTIKVIYGPVKNGSEQDKIIIGANEVIEAMTKSAEGKENSSTGYPAAWGNYRDKQRLFSIGLDIAEKIKHGFDAGWDAGQRSYMETIYPAERGKIALTALDGKEVLKVQSYASILVAKRFFNSNDWDKPTEVIIEAKLKGHTDIYELIDLLQMTLIKFKEKDV